MKKFARLMGIAIAVLTFGACSNNDLSPVSPFDAKEGVVLNTADLYDELGTTSEMREFLADSKNSISVTMLIYDQQGKLVKQLNEKTSSLQPMNVEVKGLDDGKYTLIVAQTAEDDNPVWTLTNQELMDSVKLATIERAMLPATVALGTATETIEVKDGAFKAVVGIKAAGSIIEAEAADLAKDDDIKALSLGYRADIRGMYLDPCRTGIDRLVLLGDSIHRFCEIGDRKTVMRGKRIWKSFTLMCGDNVDVFMCKWNEQENLFFDFTHAQLDLKPGGNYVFYYTFNKQKMLNTYAGDSEGKTKWLAETAEKPYELKPLMQFGVSLADVNKYMKENYGWWSCEAGDELEFDDDLGFWTKKFRAGDMVMSYFFETQDGQNMVYNNYYYYGSVIDIATIGSELVRQGYIYKGMLKYPFAEESKFYLYMDAEEKYEVTLVDWGNKVWMISYQPVDPNDLQFLEPAE